jgi:regulator of nonsense transcripts 2
VVDGVIEEIRLGLEINLPKFNQRRISMIKYLGELYNYRMVESAIIFKTFYTLITFGLNYDVVDTQNNDVLDPIDNFFRVRLVCVLLDTCGQYFDRGSTKKKLDCFLLYFQRYYMFKREAMSKDDQYKNIDPMEVEYVFTESIVNLRPGFKFAKNFKEACDAVDKMETEIKETLSKTMPHLMNEVFNEVKAGNDPNADGLDAIREDEEDELGEEDEEDDYGEQQDERVQTDYEDDENENDEYDTNDTQNRVRKSRMDGEDQASNANNFNEAGGDNDEGLVRSRYDSANHEPSGGDSNSDADENLIVQPKRIVKQEISIEDEEFMKAFDSLVTENIAQRTKDTIKMPTVDISVPMIPKKLRATLNNDANSEMTSMHVPAPTTLTGLKSFNLTPPPPVAVATQNKQSETDVKNKGFSFLVMVKKGNKTQYHNMEVPVTSEFANQFRAKEEVSE